MILLSIVSYLIVAGIILAGFIGMYAFLHIIFLPMKILLNYLTFNRIQVGDFVYTEMEWWFEYGAYVPVSSAKVININYNQKGKVESIELDNKQKMTFKEYNKISQF